MNEQNNDINDSWQEGGRMKNIKIIEETHQRKEDDVAHDMVQFWCRTSIYEIVISFTNVFKIGPVIELVVSQVHDSTGSINSTGE